jgi:hypothetical protein
VSHKCPTSNRIKPTPCEKLSVLLKAFFQLDQADPDSNLCPRYELRSHNTCQRKQGAGRAVAADRKGSAGTSGWRVYRRAPQRLWAGVELAQEPGAAECEVDEESGAGLSRSPLEQLSSGSEAEALPLGSETVDEVERRLWRLKPTSRQIVYLKLLEGVDAATVASMLQMKPAQVYDRIYDARKILNDA